MNLLKDEIRLLICEKLLRIILWIVPENTLEGRVLITHILEYSNYLLINKSYQKQKGYRYVK